MPRAALSEKELSDFRARICDAASTQFAESGYEGVTMRSIAAAIGCSPMTAYRYFDNKDDIFNAVRVRAFERFAAYQRAAIADVDDPRERLRVLGTAYVEFAEQQAQEYRLMFQLDQSPAGDSSDLLVAGVDAWSVIRDTVAECIDAGHLRGDAESVAHVFWAGVHGLVSLYLAQKLELGKSLDDLLPLMLSTLFFGNGAAPDEG